MSKEMLPKDERVEEIDAGVCVWTPTLARGVYKSTCSMVPFMDVMPRPGSNCPYCGNQVVRDTDE
jgi:hypothetical protein